MAFGVKSKKVKLNNKYTLEGLFEAIKDKQFSAGKPEWTKHGLMYIITFPALDNYNQVWILRSGFGNETNKFVVQKSEAAGMNSAFANAALSGVTRGWSDMQGKFGSTVKRCEELVVLTAQELQALGL